MDWNVGFLHTPTVCSLVEGFVTSYHGLHQFTNGSRFSQTMTSVGMPLEYFSSRTLVLWQLQCGNRSGYHSRILACGGVCQTRNIRAQHPPGKSLANLSTNAMILTWASFEGRTASTQQFFQRTLSSTTWGFLNHQFTNGSRFRQHDMFAVALYQWPTLGPLGPQAVSRRRLDHYWRWGRHRRAHSLSAAVDSHDELRQSHDMIDKYETELSACFFAAKTLIVLDAP